MAQLAVRTQRLRTLENEIRDALLKGAEEFYRTGMKLKEIRDEEYWKDEGFPSWNQYLESGRLDMSASGARQFITSAEYRHKVSNNVGKPITAWSHRAFAEITRIPLEDAPRVARKIEAIVAKKGVKLTGAFVREIVQRELDEPRQPRQSKPEPKSQDNGDGNVHQYLAQYTGEIEGMHEALRDVPEAGWTLLHRKHPQSIDRLIEACNRLAEFLEGVSR
jgi:hypothetical protein